MSLRGESETPVRIDRWLGQQDPSRPLRDIEEALLRTPREIPCRFFYDDRGSALFEKICELPEYYQWRTERALLESVADDVVARSGAEELVELGSGAATKTRVLLEAMDRAGLLRLYVPFDVNEAIVRRTARELTRIHPGLQVHGVIGDFLIHMGRIPDGGRRLVAFLGGTVGNFEPEAARELLSRVAQGLDRGDCLLMGVDLIKDVARLEAAYNDSQAVTAAFNLNILRVVNRIAQGDFDPEGFRHRAFYATEKHRIEMRLVARHAQKVELRAIQLGIELAEAEELLTEVSTKYDRDKTLSLLGDSGFEIIEWYTDPERLFGLTLARRC